MPPKAQQPSPAPVNLQAEVFRIYTRSIEANRSLAINEGKIAEIRSLLYEKFPVKILELSTLKEEFREESLRQAAPYSTELCSQIPELKSVQEVEQYRSLYRVRTDPYLADESVSLLPHGLKWPNRKFETLHQKLLREVNLFQLSTQRLLFLLTLLQAPIGAEKAFSSKILMKLAAEVVGIGSWLEDARAELLSVFSDRAERTSEVADLPQSSDIRLQMAQDEQTLFAAWEQNADRLFRRYVSLNQFAVKNRERLEEVFKLGLRWARYGEDHHVSN